MPEMMDSFHRTASFNRRALSFSSPRVHRRRWGPSPFLVFVGFLVFCFFKIIASGYINASPSSNQAFDGYSDSSSNDSVGVCDVFEGSWVQDDNYPLYNASECPFVEQGFNCLGNGRMDKDYLKWRWKPRNCDIPRFNVQNVLEHLRGKRVVFVGDSMSRTQWESLICFLMTGVEDKKDVYEVNGNQITKQIRFLGVRFSSFNFTVEFFRSVFLVQHGWVPKNVPRRVRSTLKLDKLDNNSREWVHSDILIFNTGQWWVPGKLFQT